MALVKAAGLDGATLVGKAAAAAVLSLFGCAEGRLPVERGLMRDADSDDIDGRNSF
jgi:hypothetical protein